MENKCQNFIEYGEVLSTYTIVYFQHNYIVIDMEGETQKIDFLLISRNESQLGYTLLHKLYINLAIAVILTFFECVSDISINICPIRRAP